jgi:hypothetical protein
LESNPSVLQLMKKQPSRLAAGDFKLGETKSWLGRVFGKKRKPRELLEAEALAHADMAELEALLIDMPPSSSAGRKSDRPPKPPVDSDLRDLVEEAFSSPAAGAATAPRQ